PFRAAARLRLLDHRHGAERTWLSWPDLHPGWHGPDWNPHRSRRRLRLRTVRLLLGRAAGGRSAVQGQERPGQVRGRRRRQRGAARDAQREQRGSRRPRQLPDGRACPAQSRGRETVIAALRMLTIVALQQPAAADPWGFDDVQAVETWQDILRPQAI